MAILFGLVRFSIFAPGSVSWRASSGSQSEAQLDEYRSWLFDAGRLQAKMDLFVGYSLPQLRIVSERHHLRLFVRYSADLPEPFLSRLKRAAEEFDFVRLVEYGTVAEQMLWPDSLARAARELAGEETPFAFFRLDDDDLLSGEFGDRIAPYLVDAHAGWAVSFGAGFTGYFDGRGFRDLRSSRHPFIAIGQALVCHSRGEGGRPVVPQIVTHSLIDTYYPTIVDSRSPVFFHSRHVYQDTEFLGGAFDRVAAGIAKAIERMPVVSADDASLKTAFPRLAEEQASRVVYRRTDIAVRAADGEWRCDFGEGNAAAELVIDVAPQPANGRVVVVPELIAESGDLAVAATELGLTRSPAEHIGWYRYLSLGPAARPYRFRVDQAGCRLVGLRLIPWHGVDFTIRSIEASR